MSKKLAFFTPEGMIKPGWREAIFEEHGNVDDDVYEEARDLLGKVLGNSDAARIYYAGRYASATGTGCNARSMFND